ncbi:hypothetical protein SEPCBS57363_002876 [Sporothrix epigloea]|uniref:DUF202 domain-containing protein n=1 Tax=Sporothrix epigloea TaxID=1892477 RepID=A0ABP0DLP1_9PEZI
MEPLLRSTPVESAATDRQCDSESAEDTARASRSGSSRSSRISRRKSHRSDPSYAGNATLASNYGSVSSPLYTSRAPSGPRGGKLAAEQSEAGPSTAPVGRGGRGPAERAGPARSHQSGAAYGDGASNGASSAAFSSMWREFWAGFQSIELENKGSVARDHLALERTFLAWLRTSLAFASIGIAVTQLFRLNSTAGNGNGQLNSLRHVGRPLGTTFLGISVLILFLGYHRYYQSQQWILKGKFPASRGTILIVSMVAFALMITSLVVVVVVQPP